MYNKIYNLLINFHYKSHSTRHNRVGSITNKRKVICESVLQYYSRWSFYGNFLQCQDVHSPTHKK